MPPDDLTLRQRLTARYKVDPATGCWNWTAGLNGKGYAYIWTGPNTRQAYKAAWELKYGPVPRGKELHHTCDNRRCVNPDHLEPLTRREHAAKSPRTITAKNSAKTTCPKGHPFTHTNINGARVCRICINQQARKVNTRKREQRKAEGIYRPAPALRTTCPRGHPYNAKNTYITKTGARNCRACRAEDRRQERKSALR